MIEYIKNEFINNQDKLIEFIEHYNYCNIKVHSNYISFGRDANSSPKSIVIHLKDNDNLIVHDYPRNETRDIFNYIVSNRSVSFRNVISTAKSILGIEGYVYDKSTPRAAFCGFYSKIRNRAKQELKIYDDSILDKYIPCGNIRFLRDSISLEAQRYFDIRYSIEDQSIVIPIYTPEGNLMGIKTRINKNPLDGEQKYYYLVPCQMSNTLYGFSQNYEFLEGAEAVYILESEKSVMQCYTMNYHNAVALGSSSLSKKQAQLLLSLRAKKYIFMMDKGLDFEVIKKNMIALKTYGKMMQFEIAYWKPGDDVPDKASPSDLGLQRFEEAIRKELIIYEENKN